MTLNELIDVMDLRFKARRDGAEKTWIVEFDVLTSYYPKDNETPPTIPKGTGNTLQEAMDSLIKSVAGDTLDLSGSCDVIRIPETLTHE